MHLLLKSHWREPIVYQKIVFRDSTFTLCFPEIAIILFIKNIKLFNINFHVNSQTQIELAM